MVPIPIHVTKKLNVKKAICLAVVEMFNPFYFQLNYLIFSAVTMSVEDRVPVLPEIVAWIEVEAQYQQPERMLDIHHIQSHRQRRQPLGFPRHTTVSATIPPTSLLAYSHEHATMPDFE